MNDEAPFTARQDAYLRWRQRIADKQTERRQPEAPPAAKPNSMWDPEALFRADEPSPPRPGANSESTIDLRDVAEASVTLDLVESPAPRRSQDGQAPRVLEPSGGPPSIGASPAAPHRNLRKERLDSVMARLGSSTTAQKAPTAGAGGAQPRHGDPRSTAAEQVPIAEMLQDLNRRRLEDLITDEEFNRRKAEIFERASGRH